MGAALAMLIIDLPGTNGVILGPAIPLSWAGGSVEGLRLRDGGSVSFSWDDNGIVRNAVLKDREDGVKIVNVKGGDVLYYW